MNIYSLLCIIYLEEIGKALESCRQEKASFKDINVNGFACIYKTCDRFFGDVFYDYGLRTVISSYYFHKLRIIQSSKSQKNDLITRKQKTTIIIDRINSLHNMQKEFYVAVLNILYIKNTLYMLKQEKKVEKF